MSKLSRELSDLRPMLTFRGLDVYRFRGDEAPCTMREIGKLRERIFRKSGAGRGGDFDLDDLDFGSYAYTQLIAFDPDENEIVATCRYQWGSRAEEGGDRVLRTSTLFHYSEDFRRNKLPFALELGRSVVNDQARRQRFGLFAIWKGLWALLKENAELRYFFGNVTLYRTMNPAARDLLISYLESFYPPPGPMLKAKEHLHYKPYADRSHITGINAGKGANATAVENGNPDTPANRIRKLRMLLSELEEPVPPVLQSYMSTGTNIWFGDTVTDEDFGDALEIGIIIPVVGINSGFLSRFE